MSRSERLPLWFPLSALIALSANLLANLTTLLTIGLMGAVSDFALQVRQHDEALYFYYRFFAYGVPFAVTVWYVWPLLRHSRRGWPAPAPVVVRRRALGTPLFIAAVGFLGWLVSALLFPVLTLVRFGRWTPDLMSQQVLAPLVNGFLAATVTFFLLDLLFRAMVVPLVFPDGRVAEVASPLALGVRARMLLFLLAVAFTPMFTLLGLIRAAAARFQSGDAVRAVVPNLTAASEITFAIYVVLGLGLTLLLARTLTRPLVNTAAALRYVGRGDLSVRLQPTSGDEIGVLEDGVNAMVTTLRENERILGMFGRVVDPLVRDHLLSGDLRLGGELRTASVLFCDLRGFTSIAERAEPEAVVRTLNEFFSVMTDWVRECGGYVDKFIGDAMLVVFGLFDDDPSGSPSRAAAASLRCALGMHARLADLNGRRRSTARQSLAMSIGIHSGEVLAGTIGANERHDYTVIGDTVNVAARLQELCRDREQSLLASASTYALARAAGADVELAPIEAVRLRGRSEPIDVYGLA